MTQIKTLAGQRFAIACDHGGFALKEHLLSFFKSKNISDFKDLGTYSPDMVHFPDYTRQLVDAVLSRDVSWGLLICGTGIGTSIAANRHTNIYAALCHDVTTATLARQHNNANVLVLGGRIIGPTLAEDIIQAFTATGFNGGRYQERIDMIDPPPC